MRSFVVALLVVFLFGCTPTRTTQSVPAKVQVPTISVELQVNKTTKAEVISVLGAPGDLIAHGSSKNYYETLTYTFYPRSGKPRAIVRVISPDGMAYDSSPEYINLSFTNGVLDHIF